MSENSNPVETYLATFGNKITRQQHYSHLKQFFKLIELKNPETYFISNRNYESDVTKLWNSMGDYASGTRKMRFGIVISFLVVLLPDFTNHYTSST